MKIADNILKHHLSHVYWVLGTGCAGKTTLCKYLSEKYDMYYYDSDTKYEEHLKISDCNNQPAMNLDRSDWDWYFERPPKEYAKNLRESTKEQLAFIVADLLTLPKDKKIILDGHYFPTEIENISEYNRRIFLTSTCQLAHEQFFARDDKSDLYRFISSLENSEKKFQNLYTTFELMHEEAFSNITNSKNAYYVREAKTQIEDIAAFAINHFNLDKK